MSDLREKIRAVCSQHDHMFPSESERVDAILAIPEIAEALAGRDAVLESAALGLWQQTGCSADADRIRAMKAAPAPAADAAAGPYTCTRCTQATWNDDDMCDGCRGGDDD